MSRLIIRPNIALIRLAALRAIANIGYTAHRAFQNGFVRLQNYTDLIHLDKRIGVCVSFWRYKMDADHDIFGWQFRQKNISK